MVGTFPGYRLCTIYLIGADYFDTAVSLIKEHRLYSASLQHWVVGSKEYKVGNNPLASNSSTQQKENL